MAIAPIFANDALNGDLVRIYDFFGALRKRLLLIAVITVSCGLGLAAVAFKMTPIYRSRVVLAPVTDGNSLAAKLTSELGGGLISSLTSNNSDTYKQVDEEITVLSSREFTESFISDYDLLPVLFPDAWDAGARAWKKGKRIPTLEGGYIAFSKIRKIDLDDLNQFVTVQIEWKDRVQAADWANEIADRLNRELRGRAIKGADATLGYLQKEIESATGVEARAAISRLMESQIKQKMLAHVSEEFEVKVVDKAMPAEADFPQRPNKILMGGLGLLSGALLSIAVCLALYRRELAVRGSL